VLFLKPVDAELREKQGAVLRFVVEGKVGVSTQAGEFLYFMAEKLGIE